MGEVKNRLELICFSELLNGLRAHEIFCRCFSLILMPSTNNFSSDFEKQTRSRVFFNFYSLPEFCRWYRANHNSQVRKWRIARRLRKVEWSGFAWRVCCPWSRNYCRFPHSSTFKAEVALTPLVSKWPHVNSLRLLADKIERLREFQDQITWKG